MELSFMPSDDVAVQAVSAELHPVPLTLEGLSVLHQMFRFRWAEWRKLDPSRQQEVSREARDLLSAPEESGQSAIYSLLGHKGDLMLVHFRNSFEELNGA
jgi:peroxiredoxin